MIDVYKMMAGRKKLDRKQMQARVCNRLKNFTKLLYLWAIYMAMVRYQGHFARDCRQTAYSYPRRGLDFSLNPLKRLTYRGEGCLKYSPVCRFGIVT